MDIKQTSTHLQRFGQPFDVIIVKDGMERQLYTNLEPTDVEGLLNEVVDTHQPDSIIIQERRRNGATNLKKDKYPISLGGITPQTSIPMFPNPAQTPVNNVPSDFKDYMISDLKEKNSEMKKRLEKLETENEQLKRDNFELEKENKYKDKEFELDKRAAEYEKTSGLAGIMETVSTNPALATIAATAIGRLMGIDVPNPQMGAIESGEQSAPVQTANTTQEKVAGFIRNWLIKQDEETTTRFFQLTNLIAQDADLLPQVLSILKEEHEAA